MSRVVKLGIDPGGMLSDVVETELGSYQHQEVVNLKQNRQGEWECVKGYKNLWSDPAYDDIRAAIEVADDYSGDRFILFQNGTGLYRLDYDEGDGNGYENETPQALSLPSGVTIGASAVLRFFYFRGVVRITGASEPLWYGYVNRTIFEGSYGSGDIVLNGWYLVKAALTGLDISHSNSVMRRKDSTRRIVAIKFFYVFDKGQYSLLNSWYSGDVTIIYGREDKFINFGITVNHTAANWPNARATGIGLAISVSDADSFDEDNMVWYVVEVLPFDDDFKKVQYVNEHLYWKADTPNRLYFHLETVGVDKYTYYAEDALPQVGDVMHLRNEHGSDLDLVVTNTFYGTGSFYIDFDKSLSGVLNGAGDQDLDPTTITIERKWRYFSGSYYSRNIAIDVTAYSVNEFYEFVDIPAGTDDISPNYSHWAMIEDRAYCVSLEDEEEDVVRYSPLNMFDVFPNVNIIQTQVGDADSIRSLAKLRDRLVILKRNSFSQGNFVGGGYSEDIGIRQQGLFGDKLFLTVDDMLFFGDENDCFIWNGVQSRSLMNTVGLRKFYADYVDENSLIIYSKLGREVWFVLKGGFSDKILVFDMVRNDWYLRETDIVLLGGFVNVDNELVCYSSNKFVKFDHDSVQADETVDFSVQTKVFDFSKPEVFKKLKELVFVVKANDSIDVEASDEVDSYSYSEQFTPASASFEEKRLFPDYLFRQLTIDFGSSNGSANLSALIRRIYLKIKEWK